jgi:hypothetical protein
MTKRILLIALLGGFALPAFGAISLQLAANFDETRNTQYPTGNKPQGGTCPPTGWTGVAIGDGGGEICRVSDTEFDLSVSGTGQDDDNYIVHKDCGGGECQIEARITDSYAGSTENFASTGVGIRESAVDTSWIFQMHSLQNGATAVQCTYGTQGAYTNTNGGAGQTRPRYVAVTYHPSSGTVKGHASDDGSSWTEICSTTRTLSDDEVYVFGASKSATVTLQATLDNIAVATEIDAYDEGGGGGGGGPTLVTPIENQSAVQGTVFSLSCEDNFSGQTLPFSSTGLPGAGGLSFNTATCAITGTPDADDVTASPFNVEICAENTGGQTCDTTQFTISAIPGDVFTIAASASSRTYTCNSALSGADGGSWLGIRTSGNGTAPGPGDTIVLAGGTHGPLRFVSCVGSDVSKITIRNDVTDNEQTIIRSSGGIYYLRLQSVSNVHVDGSGKWVGAGNDDCGMESSWPTVPASPQCGIVIENSSTVEPSAGYMQLHGTTTKVTVEGVEFDASGGTTGVGICIQLNDHTIQASANPGVWREDFIFNNNYIHDCGNDSGAGIYLGPNAADGDLPLRRLEVSYNYFKNIAWSAIRPKFWQDGPNSIHHNYVDTTGHNSTPSTDSGQCIAWVDGGDVDIYSNILIDCYWRAIRVFSNNTPAIATDDGPWYINIYNNVIVSAGDDGIAVAQSSTSVDLTPVNIYNNTIIDPVTLGIECGSSLPGPDVARDNIITDSTTAVSGCTNTNNRSGTTASQNFVNTFELGASSPACNQSSANAPETDYEDEDRPQDSADDQGADESAACP